MRKNRYDPVNTIDREYVANLLSSTNDVLSHEHIARKIKSVLPDFFEFLGSHKETVLVAHNAPFDLGFLKAAATKHKYPWPQYPVIDTVRIARSVLDRDEVPNCKLSTLATFFGATTSPTHRALDDARATVDVLHGIFERLGTFEVTTLHDLLNFKRKRPKRSLD
jgi:DNA polymerase III epsilon subunit-like protein